MLEKSRTQMRTPLWVVKVVRMGGEGERTGGGPLSDHGLNVARGNGLR